MFAERLDQAEHARILGRDAVGDGRGDADDLLEHLDTGVVFVLARLDLAGLHAEGGGEVETLESAVELVMRPGIARQGRGEREKSGRGLGEEIPVWNGGDVLGEVGDPLCCLDGGHCMMHQASVHNLKS